MRRLTARSTSPASWTSWRRPKGASRSLLRYGSVGSGRPPSRRPARRLSVEAGELLVDTPLELGSSSDWRPFRLDRPAGRRPGALRSASSATRPPDEDDAESERGEGKHPGEQIEAFARRGREHASPNSATSLSLISLFVSPAAIRSCTKARIWSATGASDSASDVLQVGHVELLLELVERRTRLARRRRPGEHERDERRDERPPGHEPTATAMLRSRLSASTGPAMYAATRPSGSMNIVSGRAGIPNRPSVEPLPSWTFG